MRAASPRTRCPSYCVYCNNIFALNINVFCCCINNSVCNFYVWCVQDNFNPVNEPDNDIRAWGDEDPPDDSAFLDVDMLYSPMPGKDRRGRSLLLY